MARDGIMDLLEEGEVLVVDGGYRAEEKNWHEGHDKSLKTLEGVARARHETVNGRLKNFGEVQ